MGVIILSMDDDDQFLKDQFYNFASPQGFGTRQKLYEALKRKIKEAKIKKIDNFLAAQKIHTLFKRRPKQTAVKRQLVGMTLFSELSCDLMDLGSLRNFNSNYAWILVVIDTFSRYLVLRKLKKKDRNCMLEAFKDIFSNSAIDVKKVRLLFCDQGNEFLLLRSYLEAKDIKIIHSTTPIKSTLAEITIRNIQRQCFRYLEYLHSLRWVDIIDVIARKHNSSTHKGLMNYTPDDLISSPVKRERFKFETARDRLKFLKQNSKSPQFMLGQKVRYLLKKTQFSKDYIPAFSQEIATIVKVRPTVPVMYEIAVGDKKVRRNFYGYQLSGIIEPQITDAADLKKSGEKSGEKVGERKKAEDEEEEKRGVKKEEEEEKTRGRTDHEGIRRSLYIDKEELANSRKLRSGRETSNVKSYIIKDRRDPRYSRRVNSEELAQLRQDGMLS